MKKAVLYTQSQKQGTTYGEVLADNVVGFNVDISQAGTEGVVHFQLTITKRGETVSQTYTAALRNKVKINSES